MVFSRRTTMTAVVLSVAVALATLRIIPLGVELSFPDFSSHLTARRLAFLGHVMAASMALLVGGFQFFPGLRKRGVHRWLGRVYVLAVLVGGVCGLIIGSQAVGGIVAATGFSLLAISWLGSTALAYWYARKRRFAAHRRWMIRSFALTFSAVTLRIYLLIFSLSGFEYAEASVYLGWICWVPNLLVAEWYLRQTDVRAEGTDASGGDIFEQKKLDSGR